MAEVFIVLFDMPVPNVQVVPWQFTCPAPSVLRALTTHVPEPPLVVVVLVEPPPLVVVVLVELPLVVVVLVELPLVVVVEPLPQVKEADPEPTQCVYQLLLLTDILALPLLLLQPSTITTQ